jgi:hypothetical protein
MSSVYTCLNTCIYLVYTIISQVYVYLAIYLVYTALYLVYMTKYQVYDWSFPMPCQCHMEGPFPMPCHMADPRQNQPNVHHMAMIAISLSHTSTVAIYLFSKWHCTSMNTVHTLYEQRLYERCTYNVHHDALYVQLENMVKVHTVYISVQNYAFCTYTAGVCTKCIILY